jgi:endonuclease-3 related protein
MIPLQNAESASPRLLRRVYRRLLARLGHAGWWPAQSAFEVCLGAILVQNTAWSNVEKALAVLRSQGLLEFASLDRLPADAIAPLIRASGYFRVKARRVRAFLDFLGERYGGRVEAMSREAPLALRAALLGVHGIGRETADSIVLYAAGKPLFVVDAYTRRVFARLGLIAGDEAYDDLQRFFMKHLPRDAALYNDFHAQVVNLGKQVCRARPRCQECPLLRLCPRRGVRRGVSSAV